MSTEKIELLKLQYQEKQTALALEKEKLQELQTQELKIRGKFKPSHEAIQETLKKVMEFAETFKLVEKTDAKFNPDEKEKNTAFVQNKLDESIKLQQKYAAAKENRTKLLDLLTNLGPVITTPTWIGLPIKEITAFIKKSKIMPEDSKPTEFEWLLTILDEEDHAKYAVKNTTPKEEQLQMLSSAISKKHEALIKQNTVEEEALKLLENATLPITELQKKLSAAYEDKAPLDLELQQKTEEILAVQKLMETIPNEIDELEKQVERAEKEEQERLEQVEREKQVQVEKEQKIAEKQERLKLDRQSLADQITTLLQTYKDEREKRLPVKDALSSGDKDYRFKFIDDNVAGAIKTFINSEDEDARKSLLEVLEIGLDIPGVHLKTQLHRAILVLIDNTPEEVMDFDTTQDFNVDENASTHDKKMAALGTKMAALYKQINEIETFTKGLSEDEKEAVASLTKKLKKDVAFYINVEGQKSSFDEKAFDAFKNKFKHRLHSEDVILSKQENWKSFALNLFLGVISLGILLGIKAVYSKLSTEKQFTFFARETGKQAASKGIEHIMNEVNEIVHPSQPS